VDAVRIRRWEIVDTCDGEVFATHGRAFTERGARFRVRFLSGLLSGRSGAVYLLTYRRRA
jgi:hypothetical protein